MASKPQITPVPSGSPPDSMTPSPMPSEQLRIQEAVQSLDRQMKTVELSSLFPQRKASAIGAAAAEYLSLVGEVLALSAITHKGDSQAFLQSLPEQLLGRVLVLSKRFWKEQRSLFKLLPKLHENGK